MQEQRHYRNNEADTAALSAGKLSPFLRLDPTRRHRKLRIALPAAPRRPLTSKDRNVRSALLAAELAAWQMTGGDVLRSSLAPDSVRAFQARSSSATH